MTTNESLTDPYGHLLHNSTGPFAKVSSTKPNALVSRGARISGHYLKILTTYMPFSQQFCPGQPTSWFLACVLRIAAKPGKIPMWGDGQHC